MDRPQHCDQTERGCLLILNWWLLADAPFFTFLNAPSHLIQPQFILHSSLILKSRSFVCTWVWFLNAGWWVMLLTNNYGWHVSVCCVCEAVMEEVRGGGGGGGGLVVLYGWTNVRRDQSRCTHSTCKDVFSAGVIRWMSENMRRPCLEILQIIFNTVAWMANHIGF